MTIRPYSLTPATEARPERLLDPDPDGIGRCEAVRRLLASADDDRTIYAPATWWRRFKALLRAWVA